MKTTGKKPWPRAGKLDTVKDYLRDIERRATRLTRFEGTGPNPRNYVRTYAGFMLTDVRRLKKIIGLVAVMMVFAITAFADDRNCKREHKREMHNYIIERQQAYQVQGVPTSRIIVGKREIDVYPNGLMFEGNHVVGVKRP